MGQTTNYNLPYPEPTDTANVPADMRLLAEAVEENFGLTKSTDANGWTVLNFGKYKEYVKKVQQSISIDGNGWTSTYTNLPTGISTLGDRILTSSGKAVDHAIDINIGCLPTDTSITITYRNKYAGNVSTTLNMDLRILEI